MIDRTGATVPLNLYTGGNSPQSQQQTVNPGTFGVYTGQPSYSNTSSPAPAKNYSHYLLGFFVLLIVLGYAVKHEKSGMEPAHIDIGVWNWIAVGIMATTFIVLMKTIFTIHTVPGISEVFQAA